MLTQKEQEELKSLQAEEAAQSRPQGLSSSEQLELDNLLAEEQFHLDKEARDKSDAPMAALEGFGQGATLGYLSQLQAKAEPITDRVFNLFADKEDEVEAAPWSQLLSNGKEYVEARDSNVQRQKKHAETNPWAYHGGQVLGAVNLGSIAAPAQALTNVGRLAQASSLGGAYGLLSNPGDAEGVVDELQLSPRLKNAVMGTLTGFGAQLGLDKIAKYSKPLAQRIGKIAERRAAKAMGWQKHKMGKLTQTQVDDAGRYALDEDIIKPSFWNNTEKMVKRNQGMMDDAGKAMDDVYTKIDDVGASEFNPLDTATKVDDELGGFWRDPINKAETRQFDNTIETILNRADDTGLQNIPIKEAQALKKKLGKAANWNNKVNVSDKEQMARDAYKIVNRELDEAVGRSAEKLNLKGLKESLQGAKKKYSAGKTIESLLDNKTKQGGNNLISLTDFIVGSASTSAMGPTGLLLVAGKKLAEKYGNQVTARGLDKISKNLLKIPKLAHLPDKNPAAFQALVYRLASKSEERAAAGAMSFGKASDQEVKGPERWIASGLDRVSESDRSIDLGDMKVVKKLLFDKEGEKLLRQASGLKPGSKAMKNLLKKIKEHLKKD